MMDIKVCRICLRTDAKTYKYDNYQLKLFYEEIISIKINKQDKLPKYFCFECAILLHKFHKFKEKCLFTMKILEDMCCKGPITYELVNCIDRAKLNLLNKSPLLRVILAYNTEEQHPAKTNVIIKEEVKQDDRQEACHDIQECHDTHNNTDDTSFNDRESENVIIKEEVIQDDRQEACHDIQECHDTHNNTDDTSFDDRESENVIIKEEVIQDDRQEACHDIQECHDTHDNSDDTSCDDRESENVNIDRDPKVIPVNKQKNKIQNQKDIKDKKRVSKERQCKDKNGSKTGIKRSILMDSSKWKKYDLSEEDAIQEFQAKAFDNKYTRAAYKCTDCLKGFSQEDMLKRHTKIHSELKGPIVCNFCRMRFKRKCRLRQHLREHYNKFKCLRCLFTCVRECTALNHEEKHTRVTRKCQYCGEEFRYTQTYYSHQCTHRGQHLCTLCGSSFGTETGLHHHRRIKHCTCHLDIENNLGDEEVNKFHSRCKVHFESSAAYEEHPHHSTMHAEVEEKIDDVSFKSGRGYWKPTTCHQCGKHFDSQAACREHQLEQHPGTSFCPPNERHICEICGASLAPRSIADHMKRHTRDKIFGRHTKTGERPFACTACHKRFARNAYLKRHYRRVHMKQPDPKMYQLMNPYYNK